MNKEYRRGLSTHPCGAPVLRISELEVEAHQEVQDQLHRAGFRPRVSSLMMSLEGTMVLSAEL